MGGLAIKNLIKFSTRGIRNKRVAVKEAQDYCRRQESNLGKQRSGSDVVTHLEYIVPRVSDLIDTLETALDVLDRRCLEWKLVGREQKSDVLEKMKENKLPVRVAIGSDEGKPPREFKVISGESEELKYHGEALDLLWNTSEGVEEFSKTQLEEYDVEIREGWELVTTSEELKKIAQTNVTVRVVA